MTSIEKMFAQECYLYGRLNSELLDAELEGVARTVQMHFDRLVNHSGDEQRNLRRANYHEALADLYLMAAVKLQLRNNPSEAAYFLEEAKWQENKVNICRENYVASVAATSTTL